MPSPPRRDNVASANAIASAPTLLMIHPKMAFAPSGASDTGSMKIPDPIIVPTTKAEVIHMPIDPLRSAMLG